MIVFSKVITVYSDNKVAVNADFDGSDSIKPSNYLINLKLFKIIYFCVMACILFGLVIGGFCMPLYCHSQTYVIVLSLNYAMAQFNLSKSGSVGSALISLAYFCQMRLLRKDYVRSKPNGKFMSAVCYAMNSLSYRKAQVIHSFSTD